MTYQFEVLIANNQRGLHQTQNILNIQVLTMITNILVHPVANRLTKFTGTFVLCKVHVMLGPFGLEEKDCQKKKENTINILGFLTY